MKKQTVFRMISLLLAGLMFVLTFASCTKKSENDFYKSYSIKDQASIKPESLKESATFTGKDGDVIEINFSKPTKVNTLVLAEDGDNILGFEISVLNIEDNTFETIYKQDKVGSLRYCAFPEEETTALKITITKTKENAFTLTNVDILNAQHDQKDLRVAAYTVVGSVLQNNKIDAEHLDVITDMILFGAVSFNEEGHLVYHNFDLDGTTISGKDALRLVIDEIRATEGGNDKKIHINLLGPDGDIKEKEKKHNIVFKDHADVLISEIKALLDELDADGVYFDYEYPYKRSGWKAYSNFLVALREGLGTAKQIGTALGPWGKTLSKDAQEAVDYYELMTYDMFDDDGYHATFQSAVDGLQYAQQNHFDMKKCDIGLPFYGRPVDQSADWPSYTDAAEKLGKFSNIDTTPREITVEEDGKQVTKQAAPSYFNSYQMIYDKTAFALDSGISGLMIWHYACDVPASNDLSLFHAIEEAIDDRCDD